MRTARPKPPTIQVVDSLYINKELGKKLVLACGHVRWVGRCCFYRFVRCYQCEAITKQKAEATK